MKKLELMGVQEMDILEMKHDYGGGNYRWWPFPIPWPLPGSEEPPFL